MQKNDSFTGLKVWKEVVALRKEWLLHEELLSTNKRSYFFRRLHLLLLNVTNNVADGFGRFNYNENVQQLLKARASLYRFIDAIFFLKEEGKIDDSLFEKLIRQSNNCSNELDEYIKEEMFIKRRIK